MTTMNVQNLIAPILQKFLVDMGKDVAPIVVCDDEKSANQRLTAIVEKMGGYELGGMEVVFDTVEEDGKLVIVGQFIARSTACGGKPNEYCKDCGIFHWEMPQRYNSAQTIRFKKQAIIDYAKSNTKSK